MMDNNTFWKIIDSVNQEVDSTDQERILKMTKEKLLNYSLEEIIEWSNIFTDYHDLADTKGIRDMSFLLHDCMTDDGFIDFRYWLISRGQEVYVDALKEPEILTKLEVLEDTRFELYGYVASDALEEKGHDKRGKIEEELKKYRLHAIQ